VLVLADTAFLDVEAFGIACVVRSWRHASTALAVLNEKAAMLPAVNCRWFASRYENGRETVLANLLVKMLFLKGRCSPLGTANKNSALAFIQETFACRAMLQTFSLCFNGLH
jgi:hypothetical protein